MHARSRHTHRPILVAVLTSSVTLLAAATLPAQTLTDPTLILTPVVTSGLSQPTTMAFLAPNDFLVLEKATGQVRRVLGGVLQPGFVLDVHVNSTFERGMLGIAINSQSPPQVFLYYTEASGADGGAVLGNRVYRYDWNPGLGILENPLMILNLAVSIGGNHNGGVLVLGPPGEGTVADGRLLYAIIGDLNRDGQLQNDSLGPPPDDTSVIFRVEQDGTAAADNPFVPYCSITTSQQCPGGGGCPGGETCRTQVARYYAYGVRNSFGLTLDPVTGDVWNTENGPNTFDEINHVAPGFNSGWNPIMGPDALDAQGIGDLFHMPGAGITYSDPEFSWFDTNAPTAIVFPNGSMLGAAYDDVAVVADANNGHLYRFLLNGTRDGFDFSALPDLQDLVADDVSEQNQVRIGQGFAAITDLEMGPDGNLYVVSLGAGDVYRITGGGPTPTSTPPATATPTATPTPVNTATATATVTPPAPPTCASTPEVCRTPVIGGKAFVLLKDNGDDTKDQWKWKWIKGAATTKAEFGNPVTTHGYELCIYSGGALVASATAPAGAAWREKSSGFKFSDPNASSDGMRTIVLKAGADQKAKIIVRGKGVGLAMPNLGILASPLTLQLKRAGGSVCWGATYSFPPALKNTSELFKDKAD